MKSKQTVTLNPERQNIEPRAQVLKYKLREDC